MLLGIDRDVAHMETPNIHLVAMNGAARHCGEDLAPSRRNWKEDHID